MTSSADIILPSLVFFISLLIILLDDQIRQYLKQKELRFRAYILKFSIIALAYACAISIFVFSGFQSMFIQVVSWPLLVAYSYTKLRFQQLIRLYQRESAIDAYSWLTAQRELYRKTMEQIELELARSDINESEKSVLVSEKAIIKRQRDAVDILVSGYASFRQSANEKINQV